MDARRSEFEQRVHKAGQRFSRALGYTGAYPAPSPAERACAEAPDLSDQPNLN
jgi:hypothetical protein